jgi:hypothetical protein
MYLNKIYAMKRNFLRSGVFGLLILLSGAAFGNSSLNENKDSIKTENVSTLEVKIFPRRNGVIAVNFRKKPSETVEVKIFTIDGERLYKEEISSDEIVSKRYDLSNLPDGNYYFEVSNDNYLVRQLVEKQN